MSGKVLGSLFSSVFSLFLRPSPYGRHPTSGSGESLKLKAQSPFKTTFNMELANGAAGYIPPPEQHHLGGYTTWPARTAGLEPNAEPVIVDTLLGLLEDLSDQKRKALTTDFYNDQQRQAIQKAKADDNNRANRGLEL